MVIHIVFFILIIFSVIRTASYGVYAFKNEGKSAGISVFLLAGGSIMTAVVILATRVLQ